jgi:2,4-dienoyl-CoA reductase-like NADH-dependent reductase (Old Yellow Enzyme family)
MSHEDIAEVVERSPPRPARGDRGVPADRAALRPRLSGARVSSLEPSRRRGGGGFEQRIRLALEIARAVRAAWPDQLPLIARLSCTDWVEGGWTLEESIELTRRLAAEGVDLVDCSSGGLVPYARIDAVPGYQIPFARRVRAEAGVPTAAVGLISTPAQADAIVREGDADLVMFARAMLRDPYWALHAAAELGHPEARRVPVQYLRAY